MLHEPDLMYEIRSLNSGVVNLAIVSFAVAGLHALLPTHFGCLSGEISLGVLQWSFKPA